MAALTASSPTAKRAEERGPATQAETVNVEERESVVILFSGDSGDGMQLTGDQFTNTSAVFGNDVSTSPDFPAEIRAPAGTIPGLSEIQVHFSSQDLFTAGDAPGVLVAMNPAAVKANIGKLEPGGIIIANIDAFNRSNLRKAGYEENPLENEVLKGYEVYKVALTKLTRAALKDIEGLSNHQKDLCKNAFALGLTFWIFDRPIETTLKFYREKFAQRPKVVEANTKALKAGYYFGETSEIFQRQFQIARREAVPPGVYRRISGNEALALGLVTAARKAGKPLFYGSYPITPATAVLEELATLKGYDVRTFQAEDEIAAIGSVIGAAFGGAMAATASSGPGIVLKSEGINLAVVLELPLVVVDIQRGGPSTGLPTKTEQTDLLEVLYGRNGESPIPVLAPATSSECFDMGIQAFRIAVRYMTPVFLLADGYLANHSEPWKIPDPDDIEPIEIEHRRDPDGFQPYMRDPETLSRPWVIPGTPGLEHRIGGLGKQDISGHVSYAPEDHERIVRIRAKKVEGIADFIPDVEVSGPDHGDLLVVGWGGTFGAIHAAVKQLQQEGKSVASAHLRYLNPFPKNLGKVLGRYDKILVAELNLGQLALLLSGHFLVPVTKLNKVQGQPFQIREVADKIREILS